MTSMIVCSGICSKLAFQGNRARQERFIDEESLYHPPSPFPLSAPATVSKIEKVQFRLREDETLPATSGFSLYSLWNMWRYHHPPQWSAPAVSSPFLQ
jgi:hypothetical protein